MWDTGLARLGLVESLPGKGEIAKQIHTLDWLSRAASGCTKLVKS